MGQITHAKVVAYLNHRMHSTYTRSKKVDATEYRRSAYDHKNTVAMLRSWLNWCVEQDIIKHNCFKGITVRKIRSTREAAPESVMHAIFRAALKPNNVRLFPAIVGAAYTGMRKGDLFSLRWDHIKGDLIIIPNHKPGVPFVLYMHPVLQKVISTLPRDREHVFEADKSGKIISRIFREAGVKGGVKWHLFRHSIGSTMIERGAGLKTVSESLGHQQLRTTDGYLHVTKQDNKKAAISLLPDYTAILTEAEIEVSATDLLPQQGGNKKEELDYSNSPSRN